MAYLAREGSRARGSGAEERTPKIRNLAPRREKNSEGEAGIRTMSECAGRRQAFLHLRLRFRP